jgi:hypothetical protein
MNFVIKKAHFNTGHEPDLQGTEAKKVDFAS